MEAEVSNLEWNCFGTWELHLFNTKALDIPAEQIIISETKHTQNIIPIWMNENYCGSGEANLAIMDPNTASKVSYSGL